MASVEAGWACELGGLWRLLSPPRTVQKRVAVPVQAHGSHRPPCGGLGPASAGPRVGAGCRSPFVGPGALRRGQGTGQSARRLFPAAVRRVLSFPVLPWASEASSEASPAR